MARTNKKERENATKNLCRKSRGQHEVNWAVWYIQVPAVIDVRCRNSVLKFVKSSRCAGSSENRCLIISFGYS